MRDPFTATSLTGPHNHSLHECGGSALCVLAVAAGRRRRLLLLLLLLLLQLHRLLLLHRLRLLLRLLLLLLLLQKVVVVAAASAAKAKAGARPVAVRNCRAGLCQRRGSSASGAPAA